MSRVRILREAQADIRDARRYYDAQAPGLGATFLREIERVLEIIAENPALGAQLPRGARRLLTRRFPYALIYRVLQDGDVLVLAVGHQRQRPGFWLDRSRDAGS